MDLEFKPCPEEYSVLKLACFQSINNKPNAGYPILHILCLKPPSICIKKDLEMDSCTIVRNILCTVDN